MDKLWIGLAKIRRVRVHESPRPGIRRMSLTGAEFRFPEGGPEVHYLPDFLEEAQAASLLENLAREVEWEQHRVRLFGRWVDTPRRSAWYGDPDAVYAYSRVAYAPKPWIPELSGLRRRIEEVTGKDFNSVLLNLYRTGTDSMGWHADDEPELGPRPTIASVSLGARRKLRFRRKGNHRDTREIWLDSGSLLVMRGNAQEDWQHALPKTRTVQEPRLNLTFRRILGKRPESG